MVICMEWGADLHMAQLMPLPLTVCCSSKSRLVLPFWYWLTQVVPEKEPLNGCSLLLLLLQEPWDQRPLVSIACVVVSFHLLQSWAKLFSSCSPVLHQLTMSSIPFYMACLFLWPFVWDYPGEPVPEETFTNSHLSWSSIILYHLPPSTTIRNILPVQFTYLAVCFCTIFLQVLFHLSLDLAPSTSYSMYFFTQIFSSFLNTCQFATCFAVVLRLCHIIPILFCVSTLIPVGFSEQLNWCMVIS